MAEILGTYVLGTDTISTIEAGVQNENDASCVKFDYSDWKEEYGDGILSMRIQRREDDDPYPVLLTVSTDPDDGENVMVWSISDVDTAQIGKHKAQLTYTVDGVRKKTTVFLYRIVRSVVSGDTVPDPYDDWLEDLESMASDMLDDGAAIVNEAKGYRNEASGYATAASGSATSASNSASDSEAYAKGTRGGTAVGSDDPAYHNNSKYFSEQASASATAAAGSATTASDSATAAAGSATAAAASVSSLAPAYSSSATYDVGDYVLYSGSLYRCTTAITTAEEWTAAHWTAAKLAEDVSDVKSDIDNKADIDGSYPELSAGNITGDYHLDSEPYLFRTTGGSADVGNREYLDKIVGGTVAWNQLVSASATSVTVQSGHKYITKIGGAWSVGASSGSAISVTGGSDMVIDLTALFNPTIADYIYSLEQATAGAGVSWFRNYFPEDYYPYDPGTLRSVEGVSAHETVEKNLLDAKPYSGVGYNLASGTDVNLAEASIVIAKNDNSFSYEIASGWQMVNFKTAPLKAGTYHVQVCGAEPVSRISVYVVGTDGKTKGVSYNATGATIINTNKTLLDGEYILVASGRTTAGTQTLITPQIELGTTATSYEPYTKHTYPLDSSLTLRGVPKLVDGELAFDGDVYQPSGEVQRRYGVVDLGTLDWANYKQGGFRARLDPDPVNATDSGKLNFITSKYYEPKASSATLTSGMMTIAGGNIYIVDDAFTTDATAFKTAMSGVYLVYEKATPTTETAEGYEQYQRCDPSGTEEFVTDSIVPVGHETAYELNLAQKLINLPWDMSMIAPVEDGATASQAYAQGKYFLRNNEFCKAKTAIASGATFTLNTNYEVTTVAAELFAALS